MEREYILSLSTLSRVKQKINLPFRFKLNKSKKIIKMKNLELEKTLFVFDISNFIKQEYSLKSKKTIYKNKYDIKMKHSPYLYLLYELNFTNEFILENIETIYNLIKIHIEKYNYEKGYFKNTTENIIKVIKYHEDMILNKNDIEELRDLSNYFKYINKVVINYIEMFLY
jgi:hypothetical protein